MSATRPPGAAPDAPEAFPSRPPAAEHDRAPAPSDAAEATAPAAGPGEALRASVVVPVKNGGAVLVRCLDALRAGLPTDSEIVVVDDGSTDGTAAAAAGDRTTVIDGAGQGPGAARNVGAARARGRILVFVDADVVVAPEAVRLMVESLEGTPELDAVFGSYDERPSSAGVVSQFRNLLHHFVHQGAHGPASTFWAGLGAVRRDAFLAVGGFPERYGRPAIEDIELGHRLVAEGRAIALDREVQGTHLKHWSLPLMVRTDLLQRALPWTRLILESGRMSRTLNLGRGQPASVGLATAAAAVGPLALLWPELLAVCVALALGIVPLNRDFYRFLARRRGVSFAAACFPLHVIHFACAGAGALLALTQVRNLGALAGIYADRRLPAADGRAPAAAGALDQGLERTIAEIFARYDSLALGLAVGTVSGVGLFLATAVLLIRGGEPTGPTLSLLGNYLFGYEVSWAGAWVGLLEAGAAGFLLGFLIAAVINGLLGFYETLLRRQLRAAGPV